MPNIITMHKYAILSIILMVNMCIAQNSQITFISPPQVKNLNEDIVLNCTVIKPAEVLVSWIKNGQMLTLGNLLAFNNPRFTITLDSTTNTYSLHIRNLTETDSGKYKCQINQDVTNAIAQEVDIQITRSPQIIDATETNVHVNEGQMASLLCSADGYPKPTITWTREDEQILFTKTNSFSGNNLTFSEVKKEDRGRYICEASNGVGNVARKSVLLEVDFAPVMSAKRPKVGQKAGYEAQLICEVTAYPPAAISWLRHGKILNNNGHYEISHLGVSNEVTTSTLKLVTVSKHHYGDYHCKAQNKNGEGETRMELFEQELPNEIFSMLWKSSGHRFIGFHKMYSAIGIIIFFLFY